MDQQFDNGEATSTRGQPKNIEAEMSVLGAMLLDQEAISRALQEIKGDSFYKVAHRKIFDTIVSLYDEGKPTDAITLTEAMRQRGDLDKAGGPEYIITLMNYIPTTAHLDSHLKIVREKATLRDLISTSTEIVNRCYQETVEAAVVMDEVEKTFFDLTQRGMKQQLIPMRQLMKGVMEDIEAQQGSHSMVTGLSTGLRDLDKLTCGLQPSELIVLAGRPSMGKTAFCLNVAEYAACEGSTGVAIFSLEMSKEQLVMRMLCSRAGLDILKVRTGALRDRQFTRLAKAAGQLGQARIYIDDTPSLTVMELRAKARRLKRDPDANLGLIIVDYLQLMQGRGKVENRQQEISDISRALKGLAKELNLPIIACSQLSRQVENRPDKRPQLSDLRESGAIEQDADLVLFLYREEYYEREMSTAPGMAEVIIGKQRNGPTGKVDLVFSANQMKFQNMEKHYVR